jgi:chromosomal replication initiator protein
VEVRGLSAQLASRLSAGLIVPLAVPESQARRAIVAQVADQLALPLPEDVLERLTGAANGKQPTFATPAQLRHAVLQLAHAANSAQGNIDVQLVDDLIRRHIPETKGTIRQVTTIVARHFQLSVGDLRGQSRQQNIVRARSLAMYLCRDLTGASFAEVGRQFGGRDHTTAMHACRKTAQQIEVDVGFKELIDDLTAQITLSHETT